MQKIKVENYPISPDQWGPNVGSEEIRNLQVKVSLGHPQFPLEELVF